MKHLIFPLLALLIFSCSVCAAVMTDIPLTAYEFEGIPRRDEPVSMGVNLPRGAIKSPAELAIYDAKGSPVPSQFETMMTWPDGSIKWVLADYFVSCKPNSKSLYYLKKKTGAQEENESSLKVSRPGSQSLTVETGVLRCTLHKEGFNLFDQVYLDHNQDRLFSDDELVSAPGSILSISVIDSKGRVLSSKWGRVESMIVEAEGPVRVTVAVKGILADADGRHGLDYTARLNFYANTGFTKVFFTLENHRPALPLSDEDGDKHWLMGSGGSFFFEDLSLTSKLAFNGPIVLSVGDQDGDIIDRITLTKNGG
ncbi:MAG: hypothetical protein IID46_06020, partial [Planctomycetes bacterium]|nr:hypothetical protein [Planctomycetota bacterium]